MCILMRSDQERFTPQIRQVFSEEFKRMVCATYMGSNSSKEEIRIKFGIKGKSSLLYWLRKFGYINSSYQPCQQLPSMAKSKEEIAKNLEKENEDLKLQVEMYKRMISIAEKEFKISIEKKSGTK